MKKLLLAILIILFLIGTGFATEWHIANQKLFAWDAVTETVNGDPIGDMQITYYVYLSTVNGQPNTEHTKGSEIGTTEKTEYLVTLDPCGRYWVGVSAEFNGTWSEIAWSNDPEYDFGLQCGVPKKPEGLRVPPSGGPMPLSINENKK